MLYYIGQDKVNKIVIKKPTTPLVDGQKALTLEVSQKCQTDPDIFTILSTSCSGMIQFELTHSCVPAEDVVFSLDTGFYDVVLKDGLTQVDSFKMRIIK